MIRCAGFEVYDEAVRLYRLVSEHSLYHESVYRVKSGTFGQTAKIGQRPCLFHISNIGIKK